MRVLSFSCSCVSDDEVRSITQEFWIVQANWEQHLLSVSRADDRVRAIVSVDTSIGVRYKERSI
jgi:hypothetical protein